MAAVQGLPTMAAYLEAALDKGVADPVQYNDELAHLYLRMALQGSAGAFLLLSTAARLCLQGLVATRVQHNPMCCRTAAEGL